MASSVDLLHGAPLAVGLGVPMNLDWRTGIGYRATNLPLEHVDVAGRVRERTGLPAGIENDGNAAALAEWRLGAGRGSTDLIAITLGTGVGGGIVLDERLYRGWAELGHVVVDADGPPCQGNCHGRGHLEAVSSGHAANRAAVALYGPRRTRTHWSGGRGRETPRRSRRSGASATFSGSRSARSRTSSRRMSS